ncbi:MAG: chemotaxis protein CheW [Methylococcaceae bacterium]
METEYLATIKNKDSGWFSSDQPATSFSEREVSADNLLPTNYEQVSLGFRVGELGFSIPTRIYCEVVERPQVSPLPNLEPWFNGLLNLRGNVVPVIDLGLLFNETVSNHKKRQLFAIDRGEKTIAIWIDGYPEMLNGFLASPDQLPVLPEEVQRCTNGAVLHNGQIWLNIEPGELFKNLGRRNRQQTTEETLL